MSPTPAREHYSRLESLPAELMEKIFLEALEVNLARASLFIARRVSRQAVYKIFLLQAYWNDPQDCVRDPYLHWNSLYQDIQSPKDDYSDRGIFAHVFCATTYKPMKIVDQKRLQQHVSSCRWFTLTRFQQILPSLLVLTLNTVNHQRTVSDGRLLEPGLDEDRRWTTPDSVYNAASLGYDDRPKEFTILDDFTIEGAYLDTTHGRIHMIRTARVFCLPSKALHGPWTQERVQLLVFLRRAFGRRFRWYDNGSWSQRQRRLSPVFSVSACFDGIRDAIVGDNGLALRYLLDVIQSFGPGINSDQRGMHLPACLHRFALRQAASHPDLLNLLLQVGSCTLPHTRHTYRWASKRIAKGDWFQICAYSYLQTLRRRIFDGLQVALQTPLRARLRDNPRTTQQTLRFGVARGSVLDGESVF